MVIGFLARNIAQIGLHVFKRAGDEDRQREHDHPFAKLIAQPNPWSTQYRWLERMAIDYLLYDCSYQQKIKTREGLGLIRLPPPMVKPKGDNWLYPEYFEFRGTKGKREIPADQVVYFRGYGGTDDVGMSPIEALRQILREDYSGSEMREQIMRNGARMSGYLERPSSAPKWTDTAKQGFKADWQAQYAGSGPQAGGTPILEDDMKYVKAAQTAKELQYVEGRKLTREEVATQYWVSPPMVGILDHATFSNITELHQMLYQDTLGPWLEMIEQDLDLQVAQELDTSRKLYCEFNIQSKLKGAFEQQAQAYQTSVGGPWLTINEARARQNLPPVDGGDELIRPLNVTQNGDQDPVPAEPGGLEPTEKPPADEEQDDEEDQ
jgi:HK97 family phage portal protein